MCQNGLFKEGHPLQNTWEHILMFWNVQTVSDHRTAMQISPHGGIWDQVLVWQPRWGQEKQPLHHPTPRAFLGGKGNAVPPASIYPGSLKPRWTFKKKNSPCFDSWSAIKLHLQLSAPLTGDCVPSYINSPAECKGKEPSGENKTTINFPLKNNICVFLRRRTLTISAYWFILHSGDLVWFGLTTAWT